MADRYIKGGLMQHENGVYTLTREGRFFADRITSDVFYHDDTTES